jgi:ATP-dependent 26S proteasome regulatory subunit
MAAPKLPAWADRLIDLYESETANQFILYGNVNDRFVLPSGDTSKLGSLYDFLRDILMPRFEVLISYDLGNGIRVERGGEILSQWPAFKETPELPRAPRQATEFLTRYFRYTANLARLGQPAPRVGFVMKAAHLVAPALPGALNYDLNALALLIRDWATDDLLTSHQLVTWLVADNLNDLHPLLVNNGRTVSVQIPLPSTDDLAKALNLIAPQCPVALEQQKGELDSLARQFAGATLTSIESLLKVKNHEGQRLASADLVKLKKDLVEKDAGGLIDFIESPRTLDDVYAQEKLKVWLRQDLQLWRSNDLAAMPMGYLICGPVGTGKTYLVECLAGEAGIPVVKLKNFRDKWVGSTEGNLEKIFRLLEGLGRCFVFIDEADQALGKRDSGTNDSGLSGRIYSMFAEQMSNTNNRGKIVWVLASSRPDLIEVDLKRPGRVDVKIPIFPSTTPEESFALIRALSKRRGIVLTDEDFKALCATIPTLLTPGAAEVLAVKIYRSTKTEGLQPREALQRSLTGYQPPVPLDVMNFQIGLAAKEATDGEFVPEQFRSFR